MTREKRIYFIIFAATAAIALVIGSVSLFSKVTVESKVDRLLKDSTAILEKTDMADISQADMDTLNSNFRTAYILVRKPQFFAAYKNFDDQGYTIKKILQQYDQIVSSKGSFEPDSYIYINFLLNRRKSGSHLGFYTAFVFLLMSAVSGAAFMLTKKEN